MKQIIEIVESEFNRIVTPHCAKILPLVENLLQKTSSLSGFPIAGQ